MKAKKPKLPAVQSGRPPKVNLLPPSEVAKRERRTLVRNWLFAVLATFAVLALTVGAAAGLRMAAELRLASEEQRTDQLAIELARYTEVSANVAARAELGDFRSQALSNDLAWAPLYADIVRALPGGSSITSYDLVAGAAPASDVDPELTAGVSGTLTCRSGDPADQRAAVVALRKIPGALSIDAGKMSWNETVKTYEYQVVFAASQTRYTGRFAARGGVK